MTGTGESADPAPRPPRERARLEVGDGGVVSIVKRGASVPLPPTMGQHALSVWRHMQTHGEEMAETYLMGLGHGMAARGEDLLDRLTGGRRGP